MKAIFIDIDNTLLDFDGYVRETMEQGFAKYGLRRYEPWMYDRFHEINTGLWKKIELGEIEFSYISENRWNMVFQDLGIEFDGPTFERYFRAQLNNSAIVIDGAYEMLDYLQDKYILCAASNGPYEQQVHRLEIAAMSKYFSHIFVSENIGASKPSEEYFTEAFRRIDCELAPADCMIIGDSLTSDIKGGRDFGMKTCFYIYNASDADFDSQALSKDLFESGQVDYCIRDLREVKQFL